MRFFSISYEYEDFSWNIRGLNDLWKWSILRIYMCNLKGDVVCFSRNEKKNIWLRSLLGVLFCFCFGWGRGFYWLGFLLNDGDTWAVHLMLDGGCEKDWCGYWSILCFLSFQLKERYLLTDYFILSSIKK